MPDAPRPDAARFAIAIWRIARELAASTSTEPDPWSLVRHVARAEHVVELLAAVDAFTSSGGEARFTLLGLELKVPPPLPA